MRRFFPVLFSVLSAAVATIALVDAPARACGGFFCDNAQPVNQAAERIIFSRAPDGQVTAIIQILYEGPADRFAWMLPVAGTPEIRVSSDLAFTRLQQATNPSYSLTTTVEGTCRVENFDSAPGFADTSSSQDTSVASPSDPDPVVVLDEGSVGPYDYVVIAIDPEANAPAAVAVEWLQTNGFDIDDLGAERIGPYLESGMNLLSFRLTKGNDAGAIRPVMLGFGAGLASIPIRPTAVAAVEDMGIMVWVLGPHRAFPVNYASLELNEALINWFNPNNNYNDVVTEAANQAGGQGFVTEMSGRARGIESVIFDPGEASIWNQFRADPGQLRTMTGLRTAISAFGSFDGFAEALAANLPLPSGYTIADVLRCLSCVPLPTDADGHIAEFDVNAFVAAMEKDVIEPMRATSELFDDRTLTRLYTTMSAGEMNVDPSFDFNPDLPDVSTSHTADRIIECSEAFVRADAPWRVELGDGQVVRGFGNTWPFSLGTSTMPANLRIRRVGTTGQGEVIVDNGASIDGDLAANNTTVQRQAAERIRAYRGDLESSGSGCHGGAASSGGASVVLLGWFGWLFARRRRGLV